MEAPVKGRLAVAAGAWAEVAAVGLVVAAVTGGVVVGVVVVFDVDDANPIRTTRPCPAVPHRRAM